MSRTLGAEIEAAKRRRGYRNQVNRIGEGQ
jgi:hypothetical protein